MSALEQSVEVKCPSHDEDGLSSVSSDMNEEASGLLRLFAYLCRMEEFVS